MRNLISFKIYLATLYLILGLVVTLKVLVLLLDYANIFCIKDFVIDYAQLIIDDETDEMIAVPDGHPDPRPQVSIQIENVKE